MAESQAYIRFDRTIPGRARVDPRRRAYLHRAHAAPHPCQAPDRPGREEARRCGLAAPDQVLAFVRATNVDWTADVRAEAMLRRLLTAIRDRLPAAAG